jgi:hypothetical protein
VCKKSKASGSFFEKKNQKTFAFGARGVSALPVIPAKAGIFFAPPPQNQPFPGLY